MLSRKKYYADRWDRKSKDFDSERWKKKNPKDLETKFEQEYEYFLLDSMILHQIFNDNEILCSELLKYTERKRPYFYLLDSILNEWYNMEKTKHNEKNPGFDNKVNRISEVILKLKKIGKAKVDQLHEINENFRKYSEKLTEAKNLCDEEKYENKDGEPLSEKDCRLLKFTLAYSWTLVTCDNALIDATKEEMKSIHKCQAKVFCPKNM